MGYRFMRIMVMFDLPTETTQERRAYRVFRNHLLKNGFFMLQESIYTKLALNQSAKDNVIKHIKKKRPEKGLVQVLTVTEKQFSKMEAITGKFVTDVIHSEERVIIL